MKVFQKYPPRWPANTWGRAFLLLLYILERCEVTEQGCWLWRGAVQSSGYGIMRYRGRVLLVHRLALDAFLRLKTRGTLGARYACHECPRGATKLCANPEHISPGSQSKNMRQWHRSRSAARPQEIRA